MNDKTEVEYAFEVLREASQKTHSLESVGVNATDLLYLCVHVACLSMESEREYQWENYADHKRGCALSFRFDAIRESCQSPKIFSFPLVYTRDVQLQMFDRVLRTAETIVIGGLPKNIHEQFHREVLLALGELLSLVKNPVHAAEREWRLQVDHDNSEFREVVNIDGACRRILPICKPATLSELVLGPECEMSIASVEDLLAHLGYDNAGVRQILHADLIN